MFSKFYGNFTSKNNRKRQIFEELSILIQNAIN